MNKISKICHLADIHIRKTPTRNDEYEYVFKNLITSIKSNEPDRIVIVGDLVHDYLDLQGEQLLMARKLLNDLSEIAPLRITRGNHDCLRNNIKRVDSVTAIVKTLDNSNVIYYDKTGVFYDENIAWMVWHYGENKNNPWKTKEGKIYEQLRINGDYVAIDLFHDPVNGCKSATGFDMKSKSYYKIGDFNGDYSFFGDIHKMQYLDNKKTKAYCGSLISQNFAEGDDSFHGYLLWDISDGSVEEVSIDNEYSYKNINITPFTDFDDLDFEIDNPTKYMKVRFVWGTLPQTRNNENERKISLYLKSKYDNVTISNKNEFIENQKIDINENITLQDIGEKTVQHEIIREYLDKIGTDKDIIDEVVILDDEITNTIEVDELTNIEWEIIRFGGENFMSYEKLDIDWRDMDGLFQIHGENTFGKTTIMKIISYILYNKTLETENSVKHGNSRFVNNRNNAKYTSAYMILSANDEYYGIKRKTEIIRDKSGQINGAPTSLGYYLLSSVDDEMCDENLIENLVEDRRNKTQKKLNQIIGSYNNFMRIVMTTSDTLNDILSSNMAEFVDSLLFDSGLDIFDNKLEGLKKHEKTVNEKTKVSCNVEFTEAENATLNEEIRVLESATLEIENVTLVDVVNRIKVGREYVETLTKKLFKIDPEIYNLNVKDTVDKITTHNEDIVQINARKCVLELSIIPLMESYDENRLNELIKIKDEHKQVEYNEKFKIKEFERLISTEEHKIEIINGEIFRLNETILKSETEIKDLKNSKVCPTCGEPITKKEHIMHINDLVKQKENIISGNKVNVSNKKSEIIPIDTLIKEYKLNIVNINVGIQKKSLNLENYLTEIGTLTNNKNDVEKRKEILVELNQIPNKVENEKLKLMLLEQKIINYDNSLKQIEENKKIEKGIDAAKIRIGELEIDKTNEEENIFINKNLIGEKHLKINNNIKLIEEFKYQERRDLVISLYKKCVHRDGIPRQMLINYVIPKINKILGDILSIAPFKVWLDLDDIRPKLVYNNRPNAIIDCIGASGKERTFSSVVLKFALNQINVKSKPSIFLLDEVMGKLDENSVEEFIEILNIIKGSTKKLLVIEQRINIEPDYLIEVSMDENGISSLSIE